MDNLSFTTKYINNYHIKYNLKEGEFAPQTYAMYWCMLATGINRIFTKEQLDEFLLRLAITMESLQLVENWFGWDKFLTFTFNDQYYSLTVEDVFMHFGFEAVDSYQDEIQQDLYLNSVSGWIRRAQIVGHYGGGFQVIYPRKEFNYEGEDTFVIEKITKEFAVTQELKNKASFFADDVLKHMGREQLLLSPNINEKHIELEKRNLDVANLPVFDLEKIPVDLRNKCFYLMFDDKYAHYLINEVPKEEHKQKANKYLYLAWLFAHELIWGDVYEYNFHEGVQINEQDYAEEDETFNIFQTIDDYNMEECVPLLKGDS